MLDTVIFAGTIFSAVIIYQNYIQNAETQRERERDLRDKLIGKGWKGEFFIASIGDIRVHENDSYTYKLKRLFTRTFDGETQVSLKSNFTMEQELMEELETGIESEYDFDASIMYSEPEEQYQIMLGTIHESEIIECIGDIHLTADEKVLKSDWVAPKHSEE